jgi:AsmA protein
MAGGVVALAIVAVIVAVSLFDIDACKNKIATAASAASGLDVRIKGKMGLSLFPFALSARDIHVAGRGREVLFLERLAVGVKLLPLLRGELQITACELVGPSVTLVRDPDGQYNFAGVGKESPSGSPRAAFGLNELKLSQGRVVHLDEKTGERIELKGIDLHLRDLSLADASGGLLRNLSFTGRIDCRELITNDLKIAAIAGVVDARQGVLVLSPVTLDIFGAKGTGDATLDGTKAETEYKINLKVPQLDFEKLTGAFGLDRVIGGQGDLEASLTVREKANRSLMGSMSGTVALRGENLITHTVDLDPVLAAYESSQKFNLADIGLFFITGPLGPAALKAYRYGDLYYRTQGGQGAITRFISHWKIVEGEAEAVDCAFATRRNRIALKGKLNFVSERYDGVTVALLDEKGCAKLTQGISGPFGSPRISAVGALESLVGPLTDLYQKTKRLLQGGKCEVFYDGAVRQPR